MERDANKTGDLCGELETIASDIKLRQVKFDPLLEELKKLKSNIARNQDDLPQFFNNHMQINFEKYRQQAFNDTDKT